VDKLGRRNNLREGAGYRIDTGVGAAKLEDAIAAVANMTRPER